MANSVGVTACRTAAGGHAGPPRGADLAVRPGPAVERINGAVTSDTHPVDGRCLADRAAYRGLPLGVLVDDPNVRSERGKKMAEAEVAQMAEAEVAPKPRMEAKPPPSGPQGPPADRRPSSGLRGRPADRLSSVVARTTDASVELLKSLETGGLAAIDAVGKFVISIEDGLIEQVDSSSAVAKTFVIAIEGSLSEQVTGTSGVVKKLVAVIPDAVTEQVTSTSGVVKKLVIAIPDAVTEQVTSTSGVVKKLVIAIEDAVTDEITGTTTVAKKITVSGFEIADRFVRLEHDALRGLIQGAARPLVVQNGTKHRAAQ